MGAAAAALSVAGGAHGRRACAWGTVAVPDQLGGISGPVGSGGTGPVDGGRRIDPDQVRDHSGRELAGKVDERPAPSRHGGDAEATQPLAEVGRV